MRNFKANGGDKETFNSGNYLAVRLVALLTHTTADTAFSGVIVDWSKVFAKIFLMRDNVRHTIIDDEVLPLAAASGFYVGTFDEVKGGGTPYLRKRLAAASGVKEELAITAKIELPGIINLMPGDQLLVELKAKDCFAATVDTAVSTIEWELVEGVGNALGIPYISVEMISAGQSSQTIESGNGVKWMRFINNDKFSVLTADRVIESISVNSDKLNKSDEWAEMVIDRVDEFPSSTLADQRNQCLSIVDIDRDEMCLVPGAATENLQLHALKVKFNFNSGNVNASKNYVVTAGFLADNFTARVAVRRNAKHQEENIAQVVGNAA